MVIKICKDSKTLQVFNTTMTKVVGGVTRKKGRYSITVKFPKYIIIYQQHMVEVDRGYPHRSMGAGFVNAAHF